MLGKNNLLFFWGLLIPTVLVFKALIFGSTAVWGDAPYFYPEFLKEFPLAPVSWTSWGNNFGGINQTLWLTPLIIIYGILHNFFGLTNDALIRIVFYFPAILLSTITPIIFARTLGFGKITQFFACIFYTFNTYFLLLIDGGQVGVALAYGLFPLSSLFLKRFLEETKANKFFLSLVFLSILTSFDPRVGLISLISVVVWVLSEAILTKEKRDIASLKWLVPLGLLVAAVNSYWLIPLLRLNESLNLSVSGLQLLSLLNGLFFFQPHWPANEFGKVSPPLFYFVGVPVLIFANLFFGAHKKILILLASYLLLAFLVKGDSPPFGTWYSWAVNNVAFGVAFRDSSKFFVPLFLFGGILIGVTVSHLTHLFAKMWIKAGLIGGIWFYFIFLIHPAILGQLNGVLSPRELPRDFQVLADNISNQESFFRTLWFTERHPFGFHSNEKEALDAKTLVDQRPFASLNIGGDIFNFIYQGDEFLDWFNLLGIKYLIFSGDPRKITWNDNEKQDWDSLLKLTAITPGLVKQDWNTSFPVYSLSDVKPRVFATDKVVAVVGSDDIYWKLKKADPKFSVGNQGFIFLEDGKSDPKYLEGIVPESAILVFNSKGEMDLAMSFLQKYFISPLRATKGTSGPSRWALRSSSEYLRWKYELLVNGVDMKEFEYNKGIAFSSVPDEWIYFDLNVPEDGEYVFTARVLAKNKDEVLETKLSYGIPVPFNKQGQFEWYVQKAAFLKKGIKRVAFKNVNGFHALNTLALIPKKDWDNAQKGSRELIGRFQTVNLDSAGVATLVNLLRNGGWHKVDYQQISQTRYKISGFRKDQWVIFSESYHPKWNLEDRNNNPPYSFYSMINGFYTNKDDETEIVFSGQKDVWLSMAISLVSVLAILAGFGIISWRKKNA